jgi:hypothetical protein
VGPSSNLTLLPARYINGNGGETEASDKANDGGRQLDEEVLAVIGDDVEEVVTGSCMTG